MKRSSFNQRMTLPVHAHPFDPDEVHHRAQELGKLAADAHGELTDDMLAHLVDILLQAAKQRGFIGNLNGLRTRLWWTMRDAAAARERARRDTEREVRRAIIWAIVADLPLEATLEAARRANRDCDPPLPDRDVAVLVKVERAIESRRADCLCCNGARLIDE